MRALRIAGTVIAVVALAATAVATAGASIGISQGIVALAGSVATASSITALALELTGAPIFAEPYP